MKARGILRIPVLIYFPFCSLLAIRHAAAARRPGRNEKRIGRAENKSASHVEIMKGTSLSCRVNNDNK